MTRPSRRTTLASGAVVALLAAAVVLGTHPGAPPGRPGGPLRTVFIGDSITWGDSTSVGGPPGSRSWVGYAVADARSPWRLEADVAVPGQTLAQMQERLERDVLARLPQAVVVMGGTNDVLQGVPLATSVEALRAMVRAARAAGAEVWVLGPPPLDPGYLKPVGPLAAAEEQVAAAEGAAYVPLGPGLVDAAGRWLPGLSGDGVHPTPAGARALADAVLRGVG
ncbi:MAG: SGNH/GDSL hydrolase family protein [Nocardioides sp.]